ncbi:MAG: hypothetical protein IPH44_33120 [Myxococcales bacterium]|nr:hypothetical protein [Myxococcales bacterium]
MGLGGLGVIAEGVVLTRYEANIDQAKAKVKELSGEQRKAAKEAVQAFKEQGEAWKKNVADFAKGAAAITAGYLVAKNGLQAMREEQRLLAGSAGVDIDGLSKAWGGLRTQVELMTFAQAGHQGAWKLTSAQLEQVTAGMRALEAQGFESQQVFDKFTEVIKKGKLEGLDEFGISIKSTGNQAKDLKILMRALGREVLDVGGNFEKAGDAVQRDMVRMEDGISRVRVMVGNLTNDILDAAAEFGRAWGQIIYGDLPEDVGPGGAASAYADKFRAVRGPQINRQHRGFTHQGTGSAGYNMFAGTSGNDDAAGQRLATFSSAVRQGMIGRGPLATANPEEFAKMVVGLPQDWQAVDPFLAERVDQLSAKLTERFNKVGVDGAKGILQGFKNAFRENKEKVKRARGKGKAEELGPGLFFGAADWVSEAVDAAADSVAGRERAQALIAGAGNAGMMSDLEAGKASLAKLQEELAGVIKADQLNKADKQSFLERTFGKLEEFDAYAAGFDTLKSAVTSGFAAWIDGSESLGTAIKKSVAQSVRAYAIEMSGMALVAGAYALYHLAAGNFAKAGAYGWSAVKYTAAAGALGYMAKELGGGSGSSVASSAAGVPGRPNAAPTPQSGVVVVGDPLSDDSPRERARRVRRAMRSAGRDAEGVRYG